MLRRAFYASASAIIGMAMLLVPMPWFTFSPGSATSVPPLIIIDAEVTEITGDLSLLTVTVQRPSLVELLVSRFSGDEIRTPEEVLPSGVDDAAYFAEQARIFQLSFDIAVAVGLVGAGYDVDAVSAPRIVEVVEDGPAAGILLPGDIVRSFRGVEVATAEELVAAGTAMTMGEAVTVLVERAGEEVELVVEAGQVASLDRPALGISLDTILLGFNLPFDVSLDKSVDIGGPSAGLMMALSVYDLVSEEDLAAGRSIAGTGTMAADGTVGPIGSIEQKVRTAWAEGASVFLAPASQADRARAVAPDGLRVLSVETFDDALEQLRALSASAV